jgi:hypothetical protein
VAEAIEHLENGAQRRDVQDGLGHDESPVDYEIKRGEGQSVLPYGTPTLLGHAGWSLEEND